jgi:hypothetical protein
MRAAFGTLGAALLLALPSPSCSYNIGLTAPSGYSEIAVEVFANNTREPDLERALQNALTREVRDRLPLALVAPGQSELVIEGQLVDFSRVRGIRDPQNRIMESGVLISVEAWVIRRSTGVRLSNKTKAQATVGYAIGDSSGERAARERALRQISEILTVDLFTQEWSK